MFAQDVMNRDVPTIALDASIIEAAHRMLDARVSGLVVLDADGKLAGVLTEGDLLRRAETGTEPHHASWVELLLGPTRLATEYVHANARTVRDLMTEPPITVAENTPLTDIVKLMEKRHIKRVPVVRGAALVGVVSRADIVRQLLHAMQAAPAPAGDDSTIRDTINRELAASKWANAHNVHVAVHEGVVTLAGVLFNEALRPALRVIAENTSGVSRVEDRMVWVEPVTGAALGA